MRKDLRLFVNLDHTDDRDNSVLQLSNDIEQAMSWMNYLPDDDMEKNTDQRYKTLYMFSLRQR